MNQKQIINAYITLVKLSGVQMSIKAAHSLYSLRKKLEPTYQFCAEQEQLIVKKYNGQASNGTIIFADAECAKKAHEALHDLYELVVDIDFEPVTVNMDDFKDGTLSLNDLEAFDGLVILI